jgi:putative copper export protein
VTLASRTGLAPGFDALRLSLHVLGAAVWVGGQITMAGLVPTARRLSPDAPRAMARAFARLQWPAFALVVLTGFWNVAAVGSGQPTAWQVVLGIKIGVVVVAGLGAWLHTLARSKAWLAAWGAISSVASLAALVMGVFLAG